MPDNQTTDLPAVPAPLGIHPDQRAYLDGMLTCIARERALSAIVDEFKGHAGSMAVAIYNLRRAANGK